MSKIDYKSAFAWMHGIILFLIVLSMIFLLVWIREADPFDITEYPDGLLLGTLICMGIVLYLCQLV